MKCYVQFANGSELELKVQEPDPCDGTYVVPLDPNSQVWIRICPGLDRSGPTTYTPVETFLLDHLTDPNVTKDQLVQYIVSLVKHGQVDADNVCDELLVPTLKLKSRRTMLIDALDQLLERAENLDGIVDVSLTTYDLERNDETDPHAFEPTTLSAELVENDQNEWSIEELTKRVGHDTKYEVID